LITKIQEGKEAALLQSDFRDIFALTESLPS